MSNIDKRIAECIVCAQMASDAGKGIRELEIKNKKLEESVKDAKYYAKDGFIYNAVKLVKMANMTNYKFYVESAPDQNGNSSFVIYFDIKINGERHQVSFHSFNKKMWKEMVSSGRKTRWDRNLGGSRETCWMLISEYKI